jgi:uncharacterized protein YbbC (DUF1343 family)
VELGVDRFFAEGHAAALQGKRVGLVTNHTGVDSALRPTAELFLQRRNEIALRAFFTPEHGLKGNHSAGEKVEGSRSAEGIPIHSLYGKTRRPTDDMLQDIDVLIYDIQDVGVRSYTYASTLYYLMEEAAKKNITVIVLDRPNPINGLTVDGPMLDAKRRSFLGYVNVPYCHGMTIGELAQFFNAEYQIGCALRVVPMRGWERWMSFRDTGLYWIPSSPNVPEPDTPLFLASTGLLGELGLVNIGVGYTMPFKIVGAPWIDAERFASALNAQRLPGVRFLSMHYRPHYGLYAAEECHGVQIALLDPAAYRPLVVQALIMGLLKTLHPLEVQRRLEAVDGVRKELFCKACGGDALLCLLTSEKYPAWKLAAHQKEEREAFLQVRKKYLLY